MKKYLPILLLLMSFELAAQSLSQHHWENRLIIIIDNSAQQSQLKEQVAILKKDFVGLKDRKLIVYQLRNDEYRKGFSKNDNWQSGTFGESLKRRTPKNAEFQVFLIGLDGGIKLQKNHPVSLPDFFNLIDRMPMRRAEIRRKN